MKDILFVINPISASNFKRSILSTITDDLSGSGITFDIKLTEYHRHAVKITRDNLDNYSVFCAVGGDGTVNQVSSLLVHTGKTLAILPSGSGNGLARFLNMPDNIHDNLDRIKRNHITTIDSCSINNLHFINIAGIGFDAYVAHRFARSKRRGLKIYVVETAKSLFAYKSGEYYIDAEGTVTYAKTFLLCLCNSNQFGNNAKVCPPARIDDGLITVSILKPFPFYCLPSLVYRLFTGTIDRSRYSEIIECREGKIKNEGKLYLQVDGEPEIIEGDVEFRVIPKSIRIIV